jgi:CTP:molybdopterin cytidylyltransferase MocA
MNVGAVILAAGASSRLGEPKQLVRLVGERLLERAVRVAAEAGCDPLVVVLGAEAEAIQAACSLGQARVIVNDAWAQGMASSIRCGVAAVTQCNATILMTCDQPAVTATHLQRLMQTRGEEPVASSYAGRRGVPAYFPATYFTKLFNLEGDSGARVLLETAVSIDLPGGELDIDTPEALVIARQLYEG